VIVVVIVFVVGGCVYADICAAGIRHPARGARRDTLRLSPARPARRRVRVPSGLELWQLRRVARGWRAIVARGRARRVSRPIILPRLRARRRGIGGVRGLCVLSTCPSQVFFHFSEGKVLCASPGCV